MHSPSYVSCVSSTLYAVIVTWLYPFASGILNVKSVPLFPSNLVSCPFMSITASFIPKSCVILTYSSPSSPYTSATTGLNTPLISLSNVAGLLT